MGNPAYSNLPKFLQNINSIYLRGIDLVHWPCSRITVCVRVRLSIRQPKFCEASQEGVGAHNFSSIESRMHTISTWLVFLSFLVCTLQRLYREMCFDLLGPLSSLLQLLCVYNNVSAASNLGSDGGSNNTYYYLIHVQKQLDTHKLFVFVLIITNVVLSLVSLIKSWELLMWVSLLQRKTEKSFCQQHLGGLIAHEAAESAQLIRFIDGKLNNILGHIFKY